jgi:hypothetical protein
MSILSQVRYVLYWTKEKDPLYRSLPECFSQIQRHIDTPSDFQTAENTLNSLKEKLNLLEDSWHKSFSISVLEIYKKQISNLKSSHNWSKEGF